LWPVGQGELLDELKLGGLNGKHAVAAWNLGAFSAFASRQRKTKKTFSGMAGRRTSQIHIDF
jgi:hypothetical protein